MSMIELKAGLVFLGLIVLGILTNPDAGFLFVTGWTLAAIAVAVGVILPHRIDD